MKNPVAKRLTQHAHPPSLRTTLIAAGVVCVLLAVVALIELVGAMSSRPRHPLMPFTDIMAAVGLFLLVIALPIGAAVVGARVGEALRRDDLLQLTTIEERTLHRGAVRGTLYRLRVPLALGVAMLPMLVVKAATASVLVHTYWAQNAPCQCVDVALRGMLLLAPSLLALVVLPLMTVRIGISAGLTDDRPRLVTALGVLGAMILIGGVAVAWAVFVGPLIGQGIF